MTELDQTLQLKTLVMSLEAELTKLQADHTALQRKHEEALEEIKELEKGMKALASVKTPTYNATGG